MKTRTFEICHFCFRITKPSQRGVSDMLLRGRHPEVRLRFDRRYARVHFVLAASAPKKNFVSYGDLP
jgi:hypothetical protein